MGVGFYVFKDKIGIFIINFDGICLGIFCSMGGVLDYFGS